MFSIFLILEFVGKGIGNMRMQEIFSLFYCKSWWIVDLNQENGVSIFLVYKVKKCLLESGKVIAYLHLVTDAYSRKIVGWVLADTLRAALSIQALQMAIDQAMEMNGGESLKGLIHHSDRGVQYCCDAYVQKLQEYDISISMTEDYKPTDNAIAERVNGIIKMEKVYRMHVFKDIECARDTIGRYIQFYNNRRPHMSIGYKTPSKVHLEQGIQQKMWKKKIYTSKKKDS